MINKIIIIFFCLLTIFLTLTTPSFNDFFYNLTKKDDEMYSRIEFLSKLHKAFYDTSKDGDTVRFIYPMDYIKRKNSYFNNFHSLSRVYGNYYWAYDKGHELYNINTSNIFKINELTSKYLIDQNINLNHICKKNNDNFVGKLTTKKNVLFFNNDSINTSNQIIKLNYKFNTANQFLSLSLISPNEKIIARAEINLDNSFNPKLLSYSNKIINSDNNLIILDAFSKSPSSQLLETTELEIILFKKNKSEYNINLEFYNDKHEFDKYSDPKNNFIQYKINSIDTNIVPINKNIKIINCKL